MKATGIVRRIDDLGRVVIPKEIRRQMRIREGDPLEIYTTNDGGVVFKRYQPIGTEIFETAKKIIDRTLPHKFWILCDRYGDIQVKGNVTAERELLEQTVPYSKYEIRNCGEIVAELYIKTECISDELGVLRNVLAALLDTEI